MNSRFVNCLANISANPRTICNLDLHVFSRDEQLQLVRAAVEHSGDDISWKWQIENEELRSFVNLAAIQADIRHVAGLGEDEFTDPIVQLLANSEGDFASDTDGTDSVLNYIPHQWWTPELLAGIVSRNGLALEYIVLDEKAADVWRSQYEELCKIAVKENPDALQFVDASVMSEEICDLARESLDAMAVDDPGAWVSGVAGMIEDCRESIAQGLQPRSRI